MAKILLVEDNEMNRDLISRKLKRRGFEIVLAFDGAEGIEKAGEEKPDLILMDMGLPILDGYAATRLLKGAEDTRDIPVIGLSAHAMAGDADKALEAGCDDYDTKPVEWDRLLQKIETMLDRAATRAATGTDMATTTLGKVPADSRSSHVLVVDDSSMNRELLSRRLTELGYSFEIAPDAAGAAQTLSQRPFDAVLLDVTLPENLSTRLLKRLKESQHRDVPVLMLCPVDATDAAIAALDDGAEDFVPQPFHPRVLRARLETALERRKLRGKSQEAEESHADHLLGVLFPGPVLQELRSTRRILPRRREDVAVMICDIAGFKFHCDAGDPVQILKQLQGLFGAYEEIAERHGVEKIKSVGDAWVAVAGLFDESKNPVLDMVRCAQEMREVAASRGGGWRVRFGIHAGPVVAGVVGRQRYQFDIWGSTVQTAAFVKSHGAIGAVNLSGEAWKRVGNDCGGESLGNFPVAEGEAVTIFRVHRVVTV